MGQARGAQDQRHIGGKKVGPVFVSKNQFCLWPHSQKSSCGKLLRRGPNGNGNLAMARSIPCPQPTCCILASYDLACFLIRPIAQCDASRTSQHSGLARRPIVSDGHLGPWALEGLGTRNIWSLPSAVWLCRVRNMNVHTRVQADCR